mgnify:CR=1 FL=1
MHELTLKNLAALTDWELCDHVESLSFPDEACWGDFWLRQRPAIARYMTMRHPDEYAKAAACGIENALLDLGFPPEQAALAGGKTGAAHQ